MHVTFSDSESGESSESSAIDSLMSGAQNHVQTAIVVMKAAYAAHAGSAKPFRACISPMWGKHTMFMVMMIGVIFSKVCVYY